MEKNSEIFGTASEKGHLNCHSTDRFKKKKNVEIPEVQLVRETLEFTQLQITEENVESSEERLHNFAVEHTLAVPTPQIIEKNR